MDHSLAKTITYRIGAVAIGASILYLFTRSVEFASGVAIFIEVLQSGWYYLHERVWARRLKK